MNDFDTYADWYVWAKRNLSTDALVCHGAAAAATVVVEAGGDRQQAIAAARQSLTTAAHLDVADADIRRRTYAEWFDWARRELGGVREQQQAAARAALSTLDAGRGANAAMLAARAVYGAEPPAPVEPSPEFLPAPSGHQPSPPYPPYQPHGVAEPPSFVGYAGFWRRLAAYLLDYLIQLAAITVAAFIIGAFIGITAAISGQQVDTNAAGNLMVLPLQVISVALTWLYYTLLESSPWQATLGKRALGLKVTDLEGRRISWGRANARFWSKILSWLILGIGFLMIAFTARKQGLHDMIGGTLVVRTR